LPPFPSIGYGLRRQRGAKRASCSFQLYVESLDLNL